MQYDTPQFELGRIVSRTFGTPPDQLVWELRAYIDYRLIPPDFPVVWTLLDRHACGNPGDVDTETVEKKNAIAQRRGSSFGSQFKLNDSTFLRIVTWFSGPHKGQTLIREFPLPVQPAAAGGCSK
jgi:hypothetical protein